MRRKAFTLALAAASLVATLAGTREGFAYCRATTVAVPADYDPAKQGCWSQGLPLYWSNMCVGYDFNSSGTKYFPLPTVSAALRKAFDAWSSAACTGGGNPSIVAEELPVTTVDVVEYNVNGPNVNVILFRDDSWPHDDSSNTLGLTTLTFDPNTGEIYDADMEINTAQQTWTLEEPTPAQGSDLEFLLAHEAGRFLGLANSPVAGAVENANYAPGTSFTALATDDVTGICAIYPPNGTRATSTGSITATYCDPFPRGGLELDEGSSATTGGTITNGCTVANPGRGPRGLAGPLAALAMVCGALRRATSGRPRRRGPSFPS